MLERAPDFQNFTPPSREHLTWLGQAHALVARWNRSEAISLKTATSFLSNNLVRDSNLGDIFGIIHRAIADLELEIPQDEQVAFAAGDVYDFFRELNRVVESSEKSIFIIDPYLDQTVFDQYLASRKDQVNVKLLINKNSENVGAAAKKYNQQHGNVVEIRRSKKFTTV